MLLALILLELYFIRILERLRTTLFLTFLFIKINDL